MLVLMDKKLCYSFYRANTVKNAANDGNETGMIISYMKQLKNLYFYLFTEKLQ